MEAKEFYKKSNLVENPFRSNPYYGADPRMNIWVGYEKQQTQLMKYLTRSRSDQVGNTNFIMLFGDYGIGKSHALLWARHQIVHEQSTDFDSLCYLIPTLKKDKGKMSFAGAFVEDIVERCNMKRHVLEYRNFLHICVSKHRELTGAGTNVRDEDLLDQLGLPDELSTLAKEIYKYDQEDQFSDLLTPKGLTDYQAVAIFARFVNLFVFDFKLNSETKRFKKAIYLMIDELDELLNVSAKEARDINDVLRHIYDWCSNSFGLVIALTAESAAFSAIFEQYILGRIQRQIYMEELGKDEAMDFVLKILESARVGAASAKTGYFPFEESSVEAIVSQLRQITPRKIVNTMQEVLEEARLAGFDPSNGYIDISFLDQHDILDEVLGEGGIG